MKLSALTFLISLLCAGLCPGDAYGRNPSIFSEIKLNRIATQLWEQYGHPTGVKTAMGLLRDTACLCIIKITKSIISCKTLFLVGCNFLNDKKKISSPWNFRLGWQL